MHKYIFKNFSYSYYYSFIFNSFLSFRLLFAFFKIFSFKFNSCTIFLFFLKTLFLELSFKLLITIILDFLILFEAKKKTSLHFKLIYALFYSTAKEKKLKKRIIFRALQQKIHRKKLCIYSENPVTRMSTLSTNMCIDA